MDLTPEERKRVYEEEKAKIQLRDFMHKFQRRQPVITDREPPSSPGSFPPFVLAVVIIIVVVVVVLFNAFNTHDHREKPASGTSPAPADAGFVKGLGRDVTRQELDQWKEMGLVNSYEFSGESVVVYLDHSTWIALPDNTQADFKAGIRAKWPDGSATFRDSRTGERL